MLDALSGGFGVTAFGGANARPDPQKSFDALGLNKTSGPSTDQTDVARDLITTEARGSDNGQETSRQDNRPPPPPPPPPSNTGGVDAQSLVEGLLQANEAEVAQDSTAAAQSLYIAAKGQFLG